MHVSWKDVIISRELIVGLIYCKVYRSSLKFKSGFMLLILFFPCPKLYIPSTIDTYYLLWHSYKLL